MIQGGNLSAADKADPDVVGYLTAMSEARRLEEALADARAVADGFVAAMETGTGEARGRLGRLAAHLGVQEQSIKNQRQRGKHRPRQTDLPDTDLVTALATACRAFVAAAARAVPGLRDHRPEDDERMIVRESLVRMRATLDWIETAVDTGMSDADREPTLLLQGE